MAPQTSPSDQKRIEDEETTLMQPSFALLSALRADDLLGEGNGEEILEAFKAEELTMLESDAHDVGGVKLQASDLFANELGENEERELWDHMETSSAKIRPLKLQEFQFLGQLFLALHTLSTDQGRNLSADSICSSLFILLHF